MDPVHWNSQQTNQGRKKLQLNVMMLTRIVGDFVKSSWNANIECINDYNRLHPFMK